MWLPLSELSVTLLQPILDLVDAFALPPARTQDQTIDSTASKLCPVYLAHGSAFCQVLLVGLGFVSESPGSPESRGVEV